MRNQKTMLRVFLLCLLMGSFAVQAQEAPRTNQNKFRQLGEDIPTPNVYRNGAGAPGHAYYQQQADYDMDIRLDDENQRIYGEESITYTNNSPDQLRYLWLQLDQNRRAKDSDTYKTTPTTIGDRGSINFNQLKSWETLSNFDGGFKIDFVKDANGKDLPYTINKTMMRVDMPTALLPGGKYTFKIKWWYNINDRMKMGGRSGFEYFEENDNYLYTI
ncbi:MAG: M1 family peptidase, partial [Bacteroidota bacterium]